MEPRNTITRVPGSVAGTQVVTITSSPAVIDSINIAQSLNGTVTVLDKATSGTAVLILGTTSMVGTHWVRGQMGNGIYVQYGTNSAVNEISVMWHN